jgi:GcrA cell cycle regulator
MTFGKEVTWTEERLKVLAQEYETGASMSTISKKLNTLWGTEFSRNAITGAVNRHLQTTRVSHPRKIGKRTDLKVVKARSLPKRRSPKLEGVPQPPQQTRREEEPPDAEPVTLFELSVATCRWPLGPTDQEPPYLYCGRRPLSGRPYCVHHTRLSINASRGYKRKENADQFGE